MAVVSGCWDREDLLSAYLDGELDGAELAAVVAQLDACGPCIAAFHGLKQARAALRQLPALEPPPGLVPGLHPFDALSAFLDGELAGVEADAVAAHVAGCTDCRIELQDLDAARTAVRALPRLELRIPLASGARKDRPPRVRKIAVAAAGLAAAVAVVVVLAPGHDAAPVDRDSLATRHSARTSVESGFSVIPAFLLPEDQP